MTYTIPMTIKRSFIGLFLIFIAVALVEVLLIYLGSVIASQPGTEPFVVFLAMVMAVVVGLVGIVSMYVYWGAQLRLDTDGVHVRRYNTLFWDVQSDVSWNDIEEVTVSQAGILRSLLGVGGILVQSAGALPNLSLTWIDNVDQLRDFIDSKQSAADQASQNP
ncbi:hypothetical protein DVS77_21635 [Mycolicibacterium moriokaense]|nr:hypothetical protein DVS77_21635 [Mycolicibacterium moriokaense]